MKNNKSVVYKILILTICLGFLFFPFQSAEAFPLFEFFKKKPTPSPELTLILEAGRKGLVDELGELREGGFCEAAIMELALGKLIELTQKNLLEAARKTFINIQKTILSGGKKVGSGLGEIIIEMGKETAKALFEEEMDRRKSKEKDENLVFKGKAGTGCEYTMNVNWLKKEKRVHILMEGDCHCKKQSTALSISNSIPVWLSKFRAEFDIEYYYEVIDYQIEGGQTEKVLEVFGGLKQKAGPYKFPLESICQSWHSGRDTNEGECGCKDGKPVKKVSAGPGIIKPDSALVFVDTVMEKIGMFFAFSPQKKVERALGYAEEKLAEMSEMAVKNQPEGFILASERYRELMGQVNVIVTSAEEGQVRENLAGLVDEKIPLHRSFLIKVTDDVRGSPFEPTLGKFITGLDGGIKGRIMEGDLITPRYVDSKEEEKKDEKKPEPAKSESDKKDSEEEKPIKAPAAKPLAQPEPAVKPVEPPTSTPVANICGDKKVAGTEECEPPGVRAQCYEGGVCNSKCLCEYQSPEDICGDGKLGVSELCDDALFSKQCLDSVEEYKKIYNNPDLAPRCFNNCRGCEASVPGR